jgi:hypothetical protein
MLDWLNHYAGAVQVIVAVIGLVLTVCAIAVTWWYVAVTQEIAETTHRQLSAILQPVIIIECKSGYYGSSMEGTKTTYHVDGHFSITNNGKTPVKLKTLHAVVQRWVDGRLQDLQEELTEYQMRIVMPDQRVGDNFFVTVPSPDWQPPDIKMGMIVRCTDLSELIEHSFAFYPEGGVRHSSRPLSKDGPRKLLKRFAAKLNDMTELKNPSRSAQEDK